MNEDYKEKYMRLRDAVARLYYSAHWTPDRECDSNTLWEDVRNAAEFEPGKSPKPQYNSNHPGCC